MGATGQLPAIKPHVMGLTILLTLIGYALVAATFEGLLPIYPDIGEQGVNLLGHAIAVVNTIATITLIVGWLAIRRGDVARHRLYMLTSFGLILLFLLLYLPKVGGGGEKEFVLAASYGFVPEWSWIRPAYLVMLGIHILLSVIAMPLVLYAVLLGLSHSPTELVATPHARIGKIAAFTWILSLILGVLTYILLNHLYTYDPVF